jgi:hypothetical protein
MTELDWIIYENQFSVWMRLNVGTTKSKISRARAIAAFMNKNPNDDKDVQEACKQAFEQYIFSKEK